MTTQDAMARAIQGDYAWQDRQVWCAKCEEWVRQMDRRERHPLEPELCRCCQEDADMEAEEEA